jgi:hypothetical protein
MIGTEILELGAVLEHVVECNNERDRAANFCRFIPRPSRERP